MNEQERTSKIAHDLEVAISAVEMAFFSVLENSDNKITYEQLFKQSVAKLRALKLRIHTAGGKNE